MKSEMKMFVFLNHLFNSELFCPSLKDQPERTALVFLGGVSVGLLVTLCAIVFQIHCRADCHYGNTNDIQHRHKVGHHHRQHICAHHQTSDGNTDPSSAVVVASRGTGASGASRASGAIESEVWDDAADLSAQRRRRFERALLHANMFTSSEGASHAQSHFKDPWIILLLWHLINLATLFNWQIFFVLVFTTFTKKNTSANIHKQGGKKGRDKYFRRI